MLANSTITTNGNHNNASKHKIKLKKLEYFWDIFEKGIFLKQNNF